MDKMLLFIYVVIIIIWHVAINILNPVYRNLGENYEFRFRYVEDGKFFIREMELKRKYREIPSNDGSSVVVKSNGRLRRNLSLTGMYYHLSRYGEDLKARTDRRSYCICFYIILVDTAKYNPWKRHLKEVLRILFLCFDLELRSK